MAPTIRAGHTRSRDQIPSPVWNVIAQVLFRCRHKMQLSTEAQRMMDCGYLIRVTGESRAYPGPANIITVSPAQNSIQPVEGFKILKH